MTEYNKYARNVTDIIEKNSKPMFPFETELEPHLVSIPGIKAVLFDVYGTMLISGTGDIGIAEEKKNQFPISGILRDNGFELVSGEENIDEQFSFLLYNFIKLEHIKQKSAGIDYPEVNIKEIWKLLLQDMVNTNYITGEVNNKVISMTSLTYECMTNPVWPMPGIETLIESLSKKDYKLGIISNAQFYTEEILKVLLNKQWENRLFDQKLIFYSYREKRAKPSKDFFLRAVSKAKELYNIDSNEILYIGNDMLNDIYTADQCGCRTALFAGDKRSLRLRSSDKRCIGLKPDSIITELKQLENIL